MCTLCQCHWESPSVMPVTYDLWQLPVAPSKLVVFPTNFRLNSVSKIWGVQVHMTVNRSGLLCRHFPSRQRAVFGLFLVPWKLEIRDPLLSADNRELSFMRIAY